MAKCDKCCQQRARLTLVELREANGAFIRQRLGVNCVRARANKDLLSAAAQHGQAELNRLEHGVEGGGTFLVQLLSMERMLMHSDDTDNAGDLHAHDQESRRQAKLNKNGQDSTPLPPPAVRVWDEPVAVEDGEADVSVRVDVRMNGRGAHEDHLGAVKRVLVIECKL